MTKPASMWNFETHEDTTIHFTDGMDLIVGLGDSASIPLAG